ncbi:MAG: sulfatase [Acidobacteriota bacterium]|nr:sulfatase [Acidobacteriota bacterium]
MLIKSNVFPKRDANFFNGQNIVPFVKRPRDIFKTYPTFFVRNKSVIDFSVNDGRFIWNSDERVSGYLKFQLVIFQNKESTKQILPPYCQFYVSLNKDKYEKVLVKEKFMGGRFEEKTKYFILNKRYRIPVDFKEKSYLLFRIEFPEGYIDKEIMYGITIPKIEPLPLADSNKQEYTNLIIISIDTLRSDYLGIYKKLDNQPFDFSYSPNLDKFAQEAVVFSSAYTPLSATWPALVSMFTSLYPCEHGVMENRHQLQCYFDTIATQLLNLGYTTLSLHGNAYGLNIPGIEEKHQFFNNDIAVIKSALDKLQRDCGFPFFHWYHFMGVHANYTPPKWVMTILSREEPYRIYKLGEIMRGELKVEADEIEYIRKLYAGELYNLDFELNKIFEFLKLNQLWESSMVIVTSDHGEDLYQHNHHFYHYPSLYDSALKIPLMIKFPHQRKQIIVEETVSLLDIFPTIVDYFRSNEEKDIMDSDFSGLSLLPLLKGKRKSFKERALYAGAERYKIIATIDKGWKLIYNPENIIPYNQVHTPYPYKEIELYKTDEDVSENNNIYKKNFELVRKLIKQIENFKKDHKKLKKTEIEFRTKTTKDFSEEILKRLRTLGYIK